MLPVLESRPSVRIIAYDCGVDSLPAALAAHPRFELRDKSGPLAPVPFFFGVFDYCARDYATLPEYTLFLHGHDVAWHQKLSVARVLELLGHVLCGSAPDSRPEYVNVNDRLRDDWMYPCRSMVWRVATEWDGRLRHMLGEPRTESTPRRIVEVQAAQALVHRRRIDARGRDVWATLRAHAASI
eukprot:7376210-Prymnesium_polylepis.1